LALFIPFACIHFAGYPALCAQVTVAWDENTESDVAGYRVHYGTSSGGYNQSLDAGAFTSCVISGLDEGITYYFAATAYDSQDNESDYSEEISFTIPLADNGGEVGGDDGSGDADPTADPGNVPEADSNDLAVAGSGSADTESSSTCFIGACAADPGFFSRIRRRSK
jgi:hypothetical protein